MTGSAELRIRMLGRFGVSSRQDVPFCKSLRQRRTQVCPRRARLGSKDLPPCHANRDVHEVLAGRSPEALLEMTGLVHMPVRPPHSACVAIVLASLFRLASKECHQALVRPSQ